MYVAVTVDDDPASDLHEWYGRSFFFYPDEIEPLAEAPAECACSWPASATSFSATTASVRRSRAARGEPLPPDAKVEDFGIRGLHLAYELLAGYDRAILIDAVPRGDAPGTLYVIEPERRGGGARPTRTAWTCRTCSRSYACSAATRRRSRSSAASPRR